MDTPHLSGFVVSPRTAAATLLSRRATYNPAPAARQRPTPSHHSRVRSRLAFFGGFLFALLLATQSALAVAGVTQLGSSATAGGLSSGLTLSGFTIPAGNNRLLVVTASDAQALSVNSVTFAGTAMTRAIQRNDTYAVDSIWYLPMGSSASSTSGNIVMSSNGVGDRQTLEAAVFQSVDQTTPVSGAVSAQANSGPVSQAVTSKSGDLVFDLFDIYSDFANPTQTPGSGQTLVATSTGPLGTGYGGYSTSKKSGATSLTMSWTQSGSSLLYLALNIQLASSGTTYTVNSTAHGTDSNGATTTLVEAINAANLAGGVNTIILPASTTFVMDDTVFIDTTSDTGRTFLPKITSTLTIQGNGSTFDGTGKNARFLAVAGSGNLTVNNVIFFGGKAQGGKGGDGTGAGGGGAGLGGAIFVDGATAALTVNNSEFVSNVAQGGAGGGPAFSPDGQPVAPGGGGGGGLGGDGSIAGRSSNSVNSGGGGGGPRSAGAVTAGANGVGGNGGTGGNPGTAGGASSGRGGGGGGGGSGNATIGGAKGGVGGIGSFGAGGGGGGFQASGAAGGFGGGGGSMGLNFASNSAGGAFAGGGSIAFSYAAGGGGAGLGGAIFNYLGTVTLNNVTLGNNTARGGYSNGNAGSAAGGAVFNYEGAITLRHTTVAYNLAAAGSATSGSGLGGGIYNYNPSGGGTPSVTLINSVLTNANFAQSATAVDVLNESGGTVTAQGTNRNFLRTTTGTITGTFSTADPKLGALSRTGGRYFAPPYVTSPLLDAGDASTSFATDQIGTARPQGAGVDIGAIEGSIPFAVTVAAGDLVVSDTSSFAIYAIKSGTGERIVISENGVRGTGRALAAPQGLAVSSDGATIYVADYGFDYVNYVSINNVIVKIDVATGNRTLVSAAASDNGGTAVGTGEGFYTPTGVTLRSSDGKLLVATTTASFTNGVIVVDPANGNRTILSDDNTGSGPLFAGPAGIITHSTLGVLVADPYVSALLKVDAGTGARTVQSNATTPNGTNLFASPRGLVEDSDQSILVANDSGTDGSLIRVATANGARTVVYSTTGTAGGLQGVAVTSGGIFATRAGTASEILSVNASGGTATVFSSNSVADGALFGPADPGNYLGLGLGLAALPNAAPAGPTIGSVTAPANGTYAAGQALDFTVDFSAAVNVTGTPTLALTIGATARTASYLSGSGTAALVFRSTAQAGDVDSDGIAVASPLALSGGTIKDGSSADATLTFTAPSTSSILVDGVAPTVSSINRTQATPTNSASVVYTVTFSENVSGVDAPDFTVTTSGTASASGISVTPVSGSTYTVTISGLTGDGTARLDLSGSGTGITDTPGNAISGGYTSGQFYTVDRTAPSAPSTPDLAAGSDSGSSNSDNLTSVTTPTFTGTAEAGSTVTLYDTNGTTVLGTGIATGGNWSITSSALAAGNHTLTAQATDTVSNVSISSSGLSITIDATAPGVVPSVCRPMAPISPGRIWISPLISAKP